MAAAGASSAGRAEAGARLRPDESGAASGGRAADLGIAGFLIRGVRGPEHLALPRLIGTRRRTADTLLHGYAKPLKMLDTSESVNLYKWLILLDSCRIHATR